jgi:hypothetical protein
MLNDRRMTVKMIADELQIGKTTAAACIRARIWQVGFVVYKVASGQIFNRVFRIPLPKPFIPPNSPSEAVSRGVATS